MNKAGKSVATLTIHRNQAAAAYLAACEEEFRGECGPGHVQWLENELNEARARLKRAEDRELVRQILAGAK